MSQPVLAAANAQPAGVEAEAAFLQAAVLQAPLRYWPPSLKGTVCITDEPWARDEELLDREITPRGLRDEPFLDGRTH